ncbi:MAG: hypothetical protein K6L73_12885 [Cellvibrionaceae bacterium]
MLALFKPRPLISESSAQWIFDTATWVLEHFDGEEILKRSRLILPSNEFFPGRVDSVHSKALNIFNHTLTYSGLAHWPYQLQEPNAFLPREMKDFPLEGLPQGIIERNSERPLAALNSRLPLNISYTPQQVGKPEDLSSSFAHFIAQIAVLQSRELPPGGAEYFAEATEMLAIFMGFGVLFANSAYTFRGGCGSCYNPAANRVATLSEDEVVFALALYCQLKNIPNAEATRHLKKYLRGSYKKAVKQISRETRQLENFTSQRLS